jgi:putative transposase
MGKEQGRRDPDRSGLPQRVLTLAELAEFLHVHSSTIYRLLNKNYLQGFKLGKGWRFNIEQIDERFRSVVSQTQMRNAEHMISPLTLPPPTGGSAENQIPRLEPAATSQRTQSTNYSSTTQGRLGEECLNDPKAGETLHMRAVSSPGRDDPSGRTGGAAKAERDRLQQLEEENKRLKRLVADQALDIQALKDALAKKPY